MGNKTDAYDPKKKSFRDDEPPFNGIRKWMRDQLLQHVKGGIHTVAAIQKHQTPLKTKLFHIASITGNHNFYLTFFPLIYFAAGFQDLTRRLAVLMSLGIYLGNWFKDYLCLPRPGPPAVQLSHSGHGEFGFPSTHSVAALNIPFYCLLTLVPFTSIYFLPALLFACFYTFVVSYSRVYLGMHCVTDILGGFAVAATLLFPWYVLSWDAAFDYWLFHGEYVPILLVTAGASIMFLHPEPYSYCPCFEDSACFVGVVVGLLTGWARFPPIPFQNFSVYAMTLRYVLGVGSLFGVRFVMKPLMIRILPVIIETFHLPTRRFLKHLKPSDASEVKIKSIPSIVDISESKNNKTSVKYDIDIATKFIVYSLMGWAATELAPRTFQFLGIV